MFNAKIDIVEATDSKVTVSAKCAFCGKVHMMEFDNTPKFMEGWDNYMNKGMLVQKAFPWMNVDQREFFITGNCECVWG